MRGGVCVGSSFVIHSSSNWKSYIYCTRALPTSMVFRYVEEKKWKPISVIKSRRLGGIDSEAQDIEHEYEDRLTLHPRCVPDAQAAVVGIHPLRLSRKEPGSTG